GASTQEEHRRLGRRLVDLAVRYASVPAAAADRASLLEEARQIGEHYGRGGVAHGLSASETVEAFIYFRSPVVRAVAALIDEQGRLRARLVTMPYGCGGGQPLRTACIFTGRHSSPECGVSRVQERVALTDRCRAVVALVDGPDDGAGQSLLLRPGPFGRDRV